MRPFEDQEVSGLPPPPPPLQPNKKQLRDLFFAAAVPMVGFGFMDNTVMILAGDAIDSTIGVRFGLATMTAAAFGQICSDVSGVAFGGLVEAAFVKLGLPVPNMTQAQRRMPISKSAAMAGSIIGVVCGCLLGMVNLFALDLDAAEMAKRQRELNKIFRTVIAEAHQVLDAERASLFIYDRKRGELWSKASALANGQDESNAEEGTTNLIRISAQHSLLGEAARHARLINIEDCSKDARFHEFEVDLRAGFHTRNLLLCPVFSGVEAPDAATGGKDGKRVIAVLEVVNKEKGCFTPDDERVVRMLARHVEIVLTEIASEEDALNLDGVAYLNIS